MSTRYVNVDRRTPLLLPQDLREWVPDDDMVHFVIEAVEGMSLDRLRINERGTGSEQYPPLSTSNTTTPSSLTICFCCVGYWLPGPHTIRERTKMEVNSSAGRRQVTQGHNPFNR